MNIKKPLVAKKNVVSILSLILTGTKTNSDISKVLNKSQSTISEHLSPLQKEGIVFIWKNQRYNKKEYEVNCEKIAELFFRSFLKNKNLIKFKNNNFVSLTFGGIISIKRGLLKKDLKKFDKIALVDIFGEAYKYFYYIGKMLFLGKEKLACEGYRNKKRETIEIFKEFLKLIYEDVQKKLEEEKRVIEEKITEEGKYIKPFKIK